MRNSGYQYTVRTDFDPPSRSAVCLDLSNHKVQLPEGRRTRQEKSSCIPRGVVV